MALFLHRAAAPAGVNLPTTVTDQGLIDISGHAQDEINQIVELGIMEPRTNMTFNPNDHVTRADMAQHLHAFLQQATPGPG
ncbi:MAG: S-layer homology domain-containing protein, partial [bacterium]|nr:S-layer homology domain-containing protein [bacterium]